MTGKFEDAIEKIIHKRCERLHLLGPLLHTYGIQWKPDIPDQTKEIRKWTAYAEIKATWAWFCRLRTTIKQNYCNAKRLPKMMWCNTYQSALHRSFEQIIGSAEQSCQPIQLAELDKSFVSMRFVTKKIFKTFEEKQEGHMCSTIFFFIQK